MRRLVAALGATVLFCIPMFAFADTVNVNFEPTLYSVGNINAQNGWIKTGAYDVAVSSTAIPASFGTQSLRVSDAVTSGSFGDQTFSPSLTNEAGESTAQNNGLSGGTRQTHFETQFDIASAVPGAQQPGLHMTVSSDRGDGARMSYLRFEDQANGIHVFSDDYIDAAPQGTLAVPAQGCDVTDDWTDDDIATLDRTTTHSIKLTIDFVDGPANDVLKVYVDGVLKHTGTTWEDYYRWCTESGGGVVGDAAADVSRTVDSLLFREAGTQTLANNGNGFLVDNMTLNSGPALTSSTVVVMPSNMHNWVFINDQTNGAGSGTMVTGPATAPLGDGSAQLTATTSADGQILALPMGGTKLADLTTLQYSTYQDASNPSNATAIALQFNVDKDITDADNSWQGRIVYEPYINNGGTVPLGSWNTWDALNSGNAKWWFSKPSAFGGNCSQASPCTLTQILALYPNIGINPALGAVVLKAGSGWSLFSGNVDKLVIGVNNANTTYDFDPAPAPTTATVTIYKYVDGQHATVENANNATFPFTATYQASNIAGGAAGSDPFTIGATGNNVSTGNPYEIKTIPLAFGASYSASENVAGNDVVGATCTDGKPFALAGYSSGNTFNEAFTSASSSTAAPAFTGLQSDKVVIVWNKTCPAAPPVAPQVHIFKFIDGVQATAANNTATFPMNASWVSSTLGTVPSVGFTLSPTGWGASDIAYEASYMGGAAGDSYATNEVLTTPLVGEACDGSHTYRLEGYTTGDTLDEAKNATLDLNSPSFTDIQNDKYVIVWNSTCPTTGSLTVTKSSIGGNNTFNFTSDIPGHASFQITTSNNTGSITFDNLTPATYHVTEVNQPSGWTQTDTSCDEVPLGAGQAQACVVTDTKNKLLGSIRGSKFEDWDGDGSAFETKWEVGLQGWTIYIDKNNNGQLDAGEVTATTNASGLYIFSGLPAGTYVIREVQQSGWTQTYPSANAMSDKWVVNLAAGQNAKKKDFGNFKLGTISGMKYNDLNGNRHKDANEPALPGITIKLKGSHGFSVSTVTDANGNYAFGNLGAGNYVISEVVPSGWRQTQHPSPVRIVSGKNASNENFGNTQKPANHGHGSDDDNDN